MRTLLLTLVTGLVLLARFRRQERHQVRGLRSNQGRGRIIRRMGHSVPHLREIKTRKTKNYLVTLYKGNEYQVVTCGDKIENLDVLLYDTNGNVLSDTTSDREPKITFAPEHTGSYYVVLYLREAKSARIDAADVAMALVYK